MSVTACQEVWRGTRSADTDEAPVHNYVRTFQVLTDTMTDDQSTVLVASDPNSSQAIPHIYDNYVDSQGNPDPSSRCTKLAADQDQDDPFTWLVTATYSTQRITGEEAMQAGIGQTFIDPTQRPTRIRITFNRYTEQITLDVDDLPICNSAGDLYKGIERDQSRPVLTFVRNEPQMDLSFAMYYRDTINSDTFLGFPPHTCKVAAIEYSDQMFESNIIFWEVTYKIEVNDKTWDRWYQDRGPNVLDGTTGKLTPALGQNGQPLGGQPALDGTGKLAAPNSAPIWRPPNSTPGQGPDDQGNGGYQVYDDVAFADLQLPTGVWQGG